MLRLNGKTDLPNPLKSPIVTLGVFDGVHQGHQQLLNELIRWASSIGGESVVVTFDQHPQVVLSGLPPSSITSLDHRLALFEQVGMDVCVVLEFTMQLAEVTAEEFVREYLCGWLGTRGVLLGYDCRFGKGARGNINLLQTLAPDFGFEARAFEQCHLGQLIPSSTAIREAIVVGELEKAGAMLGRPVSIMGRVVEGDHRGQALGFPTANIEPHHEIHPPPGVYACRVAIDGTDYLAVTNIGTRPTVKEEGVLTVETHVLDFDGDLYGQSLDTRFLHFLRSEMKFSGLDELKAQIQKDIQQARELLSG